MSKMTDNDPGQASLIRNLPDKRSGDSSTSVQVRRKVRGWVERAKARVDRLRGWMVDHSILTFLIWALWLSGICFLFGPYSYVKVIDSGNGTLPGRMYAADALLHGVLGEWFPLAGCGSDRVLNNYWLEIHNVVLCILPGWAGYGAILFLQRFVAGYFFFRLGRDVLRLDDGSAMLAGMVYSLYNQRGIHYQWDGFTLYDGFGLPAIPFLFWSLHQLHRRESWLSYALGVLIGIWLALSAHFFQVIFFPFLIVYWFIVVKRDFGRRILALLASMAVGWTILQAPHLYRAFEFAPESHRAEIEVSSDSPYVQYIENVESWPKMVTHDNRIYLWVSLIALLLTRFKALRLGGTLIAVALILGFVANYYFFADSLFRYLGPLHSFHFHRLILVVPFLIVLATAFALHALVPMTSGWHRGKWSRAKSIVAWVLIVSVVVEVTSESYETNRERFKNMLHGESYSLLYHHPDVIRLVETTRGESDYRVVCVTDAWRDGLGVSRARDWTFCPGYAWAYGLETADGYLVLYSRRYKEFWSQVLAPLLEFDERRFQQHQYWGNMVYLWFPSDGLMDGPFECFYNLDLLSLANVRYVISPVELDDDALELLPSDGREQFEQRKGQSNGRIIGGMFTGQMSWTPLYIYENTKALPRYFFAGSVDIGRDTWSTLSKLGVATAEQLRSTVILNRDDLAAPMTDDQFGGATGVVRLVSKKPDRIQLEVKADSAGMVVVTNTYDEAWHALVDGQPSNVLPANHVFQGVMIDSGFHRVVLFYDPPSLLGDLITGN